MGSRLEKNSDLVRKRIASHAFDDEEGDEYEGSKFGGFSDYFRRKKIKLQNLDADIRSSSLDKPQIFRGVVAHVNGYTQPSLNELHHLIVSHGGGFMQYLDGKTMVTHIIASSLTPKKAIEFKRYRIVKPAWIVDSIKLGRVLPWDSYRVLGEGIGQRLLGFDEGKVVSQTNTPQKGYRDQTNTSWYENQVKKFVGDIHDDDEGTQFPSSQKVTFNRGYEAPPSSQQMESNIEGNVVNSQPFPSSSGSFAVTSSLEDALDQAALLKAPVQKTVEEKEKGPMPKIPFRSSPLKQDDCGQYEDIDDVHAPSEYQSRFSKRPQELESASPSKDKVLTAEEHNALLLADPKIRQSSTANPDFLKQFYSESRLHHLSTWKADLKSRFQQMAAEKSASQKRAKRKPGSRRYIIHVDFDSFFCAVSLKNAPEYINKPAVVAHGTGSGSEIASCNYPARNFGVKNGMWMKQALKLCPNVKVLPYDFPAYEEASKGFYECILDVGGIVQSVSVDEALIDISTLCLSAGGSDGSGVSEGSIWREQEKADEIAHSLRNRIKDKTGCAVSVGIGGNILLAKVALRKAKPAGQYQIKPEEVLDFVGELTVQDLPGVAYSIGGKLEEIGVMFVKDVRHLSKSRLMAVLGPKTGEKIWDYSRGLDRTDVGEQVVRKSVSAEVNWGIRFISQPEAEEFVQNLCGELHHRLLEQRVRGRQFTMKIMKKAVDAPLDPPKHLGHGKCDTYNKSVTLGVPTNSPEIIGREAVSILRSYGFSPGELRGLGVQMTKLEPLKDMMPEGNQRRINFGATPKAAKQIEDPINDPETPTKSLRPPADVGMRATDPIVESPTSTKTSQRRNMDADPIDEFSPMKPKETPIHPAAAILRANASDHSAKKLNITGTQFIIPTQIDAEVLKELPPDIRSKLMAKSKAKPTTLDHSPLFHSRSPSPPRNDDNIIIPSQLDPEVFAALPPDIKAEILASHAHIAGNPGQTLLPQSPPKNYTLPPKLPTPTKKRGRGRPRKEDSRPAIKVPNFSNPFRKAKNPSDPSDLDPLFLAALPEEMRFEILADHRSQVEQNVALAQKLPLRPYKPPIAEHRSIRLPSKQKKPTFTTQDLSKLPELRETLSAWYQEFIDEGPHPDDVAAMERYLSRVVLEERNMSKVVSVVRWIQWLVDEDGGENREEDIYDVGEEGNRNSQGVGKREWIKALGGIKEKIQAAVKERGLGRLEL
ncbi:hypothetical protein B7494_g3449 [Chlorociboria aeruginascens]|nr:hypothetical protein B7494_g3449 [Chlorociboria aeruginascens]